MERSPETFQTAQLVACDFDGTIARTFEPSPNNINVYESYRLAIEKVLGAQATEQYISDGGHNNRAPVEIVDSLLPKLEARELNERTDRVVEAKLQISVNEIGVSSDGLIWPRQVEGFTECWKDIHERKIKGEAIDTAIISSGHTSFIEKSFDTWGLPYPDLLLTHETLVEQASDLPTNQTVKPAPLMMNLAKDMWVSLYGLENDGTIDGKINSRILYIGDDIEKDGGLAKNSGVEFVHLDLETSSEGWKQVEHWIRLGRLAISEVSDE
jgi:2-hydroxy-3-keto-5-methylthiopentenyl-1-phosphate phosphatase